MQGFSPFSLHRNSFDRILTCSPVINDPLGLSRVYRPMDVCAYNPGQRVFGARLSKSTKIEQHQKTLSFLLLSNF